MRHLRPCRASSDTRRLLSLTLYLSQFRPHQFQFFFSLSPEEATICRSRSLFRILDKPIFFTSLPLSFSFSYRTAHIAVLIPRICIVLSIPFRHFISITVSTRSAQLHYYRKPLDILYRFFSAYFHAVANIIIVMHLKRNESDVQNGKPGSDVL